MTAAKTIPVSKYKHPYFFFFFQLLESSPRKLNSFILHGTNEHKFLGASLHQQRSGGPLISGQLMMFSAAISGWLAQGANEAWCIGGNRYLRLPPKSAGLLRAGARALRLIRPHLFVEISKTAAERRGARLPRHSARRPRAPAAACHFAGCLFVCLHCFRVARPVSRKSKEQHVSSGPGPRGAYLMVLANARHPHSCRGRAMG